MFSRLFKQKNKNIAQNLYACALESARKEIFYTKYGVPDTFDGRFDLLLLHVFLILHRTMDCDGYDELSQDLFDMMFKDMDQTLREIGIGDVGIPKHMKKMMKAFNGRMHNYQMSIDPQKLNERDLKNLEDVTLKEVLARNLYAVNSVDDEIYKGFVGLMYEFVHSNLNNNDEAEIANLMSGCAKFIISEE